MKKVQLLDARPAAEAEARPIADAVNIPLHELDQRLWELPAKDVPIELPDLPGAKEAEARLNASGRTAIIVPVRYGTTPRARLWSPSPWIEAIAPTLSPGLALDAGCGSGRDAVYLASLGWRVVAVDVLPDALEQGRALARRYLDQPEAVAWQEADLRHVAPSGLFDLIVMVRFLDRTLLDSAHDRLRRGGSVLLDTFSTVHRARHGKPSQAVDPDELPCLCPGLETLKSEAVWEDDRHFARLWASRGSASA